MLSRTSHKNERAWFARNAKIRPRSDGRDRGGNRGSGLLRRSRSRRALGAFLGGRCHRSRREPLLGVGLGIQDSRRHLRCRSACVGSSEISTVQNQTAPHEVHGRPSWDRACCVCGSLFSNYLVSPASKRLKKSNRHPGFPSTGLRARLLPRGISPLGAGRTYRCRTKPLGQASPMATATSLPARVSTCTRTGSAPARCAFKWASGNS